MRRTKQWALFAAALGALSCGAEEALPEPEPAAAREGTEPAGALVPSAEAPPALLEIPEPEPRVSILTHVEVLTSSVQDGLQQLGDKLLVRDFEGARTWLGEGFLGRDVFASPVGEQVDLPLDARWIHHRPREAAVVGPEEFLASLERTIAPWRRVEESRWTVLRAEFLRAEPVPWGRVEFEFRLSGLTEEGGRKGFQGKGTLRVERLDASWCLARFELDELSSREKEEPLFADVSRSTGVSHEGLRFGRPGNDSDAWNGLAAGDVNGDGLFDVFVPSSQRNFLYVSDGRGGFSEEAPARGLDVPGGGTGAVFFDYDNDGDSDLAVAQVGRLSYYGKVEGERLRLYENDGRGAFRDVSAERGFDLPRIAYSLAVFDYDDDGYLDLYVAGYGDMAREKNDSWISATNGAPDSLLRNVGGERFIDVTEEAGLSDSRWSYASAAADFDGDGDQDLYVATNFSANRLWRNRGDGTFEDVAAELGVAAPGNSMGVAWGDLDADGLLDLFMGGPSSRAGQRVLGRLESRVPAEALGLLENLAAGNRFFPGRPGGGFEEDRAEAAGLAKAGWAWGVAIADFDLDGLQDVYCANGFVTGDLPRDT